MNDIKETTNVTRKTSVYPYVLCALFAALTAVCSFIYIPLPFTPVPINLATLSVFLAGGVLGAKYGAISQFVYVLIGAIGIPVYSNFTGGLGILTGPTGGFLIGYIAGAFVIGLALKGLIKNSGSGKSQSKLIIVKIVISCIAGMITCFALGTIWFMIITNTNLWASLVACVFPFLLGDAIKIVVATLLILRLRKHISI